MNCAAVQAAKAASKRITISSATSREAMISALTTSGVSSLGVRAGAITTTGWGSKVTTVSAPSITSR